MFLITALVLATVSPALSDQCCATNAHIASAKGGDGEFCYDVQTNNRTELSAKCVNRMTFNLDEANYTINRQGIIILQALAQPEINYISVKGEYCFGNQITDMDARTKPINATAVVVLCDYIPEAEDNTAAYCMAVSAAFYAITALLYLALSELRDLSGKSIICMCVSLAIGLAMFSAMRTVEYSDMILCAIRGFIVYFFIIASFFWMNVISLECFYSHKRICTPDYGWQRFGFYSLYAWGMSVLCTVILAIANYTSEEMQGPEIGFQTCFINSMRERWIYLYSVMTVIILINTGLFIYMSSLLYNTKFSSNSVRAIKYKLGMSIKLFFIMGLPWILECISGSTGASHWLFLVFDMVTALQGIFLFFVLVVLRKRCIKAIHRRGWFYCLSDAVEKHLAVAHDDEADIVEHTDIPMDRN